MGMGESVPCVETFEKGVGNILGVRRCADSGGAEGVNASPDATMAVSNSIVSSNAKLDVFLKDFIESLNESVEQSKKPGASKFSVEAVYGDCQSLLLDLVKATKRLVSVFKSNAQIK